MEGAVQYVPQIYIKKQYTLWYNELVTNSLHFCL